MSVDSDVARSLVEASRAFEVFNAGLSAFQADVARERWTSAEAERLDLHDALDKYLDAFGAAHKRLAHARREGG